MPLLLASSHELNGAVTYSIRRHETSKGHLPKMQLCKNLHSNVAIQTPRHKIGGHTHYERHLQLVEHEHPLR